MLLHGVMKLCQVLRYRRMGLSFGYKLLPFIQHKRLFRGNQPILKLRHLRRSLHKGLNCHLRFLPFMMQMCSVRGEDFMCKL